MGKIMSKKIDNMSEGELVKYIGKWVVIFALLLTGFITSCTSISAGHVGVVTRFGAVQPYTLKEGINFKRPFGFESVYEMNTKTQPGEAEAGASSKDLQAVRTKITIQYSVHGPSAPRVFQRFGLSEDLSRTVLSPAVQESVKAVTSRYTAEELITKRGEVKTFIEQELFAFVNKTLSQRELKGAIEIANVAITDFDFSNEFNASIEAKVKAEQDALKALNEKKKKITQAEADAAEKKLAADALAYKTKVESEARADAIRIEAEALRSQPQLIELRR